MESRAAGYGACEMIRFPVKSFLDMQDVLVQWSNKIHTQAKPVWRQVPEPNKLNLSEKVMNLLGEMDAQEFVMCRLGAERLLSTLETTSEPERIVSDIDDLRRRLLDQMESIFCLLLSLEEKELYQASNPLFGNDVDSAFPEISEDIEEAGKCIALERATAAVFHLGRAMERTVSILATKLKIPSPDREWGKLLSDLDGQILAMPKGTLKDAWSACRANLYHVKQAWRNPTMHPKKRTL
jgi:hypothetical protein